MRESMKKIVVSIFILIVCLPFLWHTSAIAAKNSLPNILLVTFDTIRADHVGCYGYKGVKTPHIDKLAKEGCLFEKAFTPVPITFPAHTSMLTGLYPPTHGARNNAAYALSDAVVTLPEMLKQQGYATGAFVSAYILDRRFGLDQGFDTYDDDLTTNVEPKLQQKERRAETTTKATLKWLDQIGKKRFFLWVHYFDPHDAYQPPAPFSQEYAKNPYDGEIAYADYWLGKLLEKLDRLKITDNTIIVLAGDHGEGLGEHHEKTHGIFIYDSTLWVPLIFKYPGLLPEGKHVPSLVRLIDITPTLLGMIDEKIPATMEGVSLLPLMSGKKSDPGLTLYCETYYPKSTHNWSPLEGLRTQHWKYINAPVQELYRLEKDSEEKINLFDKEKDEAKEMEKKFSSLKKKITPKESYSTTLAMDEKTREKMRSLGYVWTPTSGEERGKYPDPKQMIEVLEYIDKGAEYFATQEYDKAEEVFKKVLEKDPENTDAYVTLGHVYDFMGEVKKSIDSFEKALRLDPENLRIYIQLGVSYMKSGKYDEGVTTFNKALQINPRCKEAYENIGLYHFQKEEWQKAEEYFGKAIEVDSDDEMAQNYLSVIYQRKGEYSRAIQLAEEVLTKDPNNVTALLNLGSTYQAASRPKDAMEVLEKAVRVKPDFGRAYYFLGLVYFQGEKMTEAITAFRQAIKNNANVPEAHFNLGYIYAQQNNLEKAKKELQAALDVKPDFNEARQMLERLKGMVPR